VITLDIHIWIWWVHGAAQLTPAHWKHLQDNEAAGLGVSVISCWEVAKMVELGRLALPCPLADWMNKALAYPGIRLLDLTPGIAIEATQLPGSFHRDPADQIIVATARVHNCPLLTVDARILAYPHVTLLR
jgi:PIN domain nuclease of toxin-antitoxin system